MDLESPFSELARRLSFGEPEAVAELERRFGQHLRLVARNALRRLRISNAAEATEICQLIWLDLLRKPRLVHFSTEDQIRGYLAMAVENRVRALIREQSALCRTSDRVESDICIKSLRFVDPRRGPVARAMDAELVADIRHRLGAVLCQVHELRSQGLSWPEVAKMCDLSADSIRKQYDRAIEKIRIELVLCQI